jgi:hypothetical protein
VTDREVGDDRNGPRRQHRVDRGQRDVERDVTAEEMAEQVGRGTAGRRGEQHHADREERVHVERLDQPERHDR